MFLIYKKIIDENTIFFIDIWLLISDYDNNWQLMNKLWNNPSDK